MERFDPSAQPPALRVIALIGLSGTGKSSVGQLLAAQLGCSLLDTDTLVVQVSGRSIAQIFAEDGEPRFRELESQALSRALATTPSVVATGGGIVLREANRTLLRSHARVIWLDAPTPVLLARLRAHDEVRPLLAGADPAAQLEQLRAARGGLYAELAELRVNTEEKTIADVCEEILHS